MKVLGVFLLLVAGVASVWDQTFCQKQKTKVDVRHIPPPEYSFNFRTTMEETVLDHLTVMDTELALSRKYQILTIDHRSPNDRTKSYVFPGQDFIKETTFKTGKGGDCKSKPLEGSSLANLFNIHRDNDTKQLTLPALRYMLPYSDISEEVTFMGEFVVRGIEARGWSFCAYQDWTNDTIYSELYYSYTMTMPGSISPVPVKSINVVKTQNGTVTTHRYDYTRYIDHVHPHSREYEVPSLVYCKDGVDADYDLPKPPRDVHFQAIQAELGNTDGYRRPEPMLQYTSQTFSSDYKIFNVMYEKPWNVTITDKRVKKVHYYKSGLEYDINMDSGKCSISKKFTGNDDYEIDNFGDESMKTPPQFFDLDGNDYQYIGRHYHFDRDIEADVYTSVLASQTNAEEMTWWFASKPFLTLMGYPKDYMLPLRFRAQTQTPADTEVVDIFDFSTKVRQGEIFPDLSSCFSSDQKLYVEITLKGHYYKLYLVNPDDFRSAFKTTLMEKVKFVDLARISRLRVSPASTGQITVKFTVLNISNEYGNVLKESDDISNEQFWAGLKKSLDNNDFTVIVHNMFGKIEAPALSYYKDLQDPTSFSGRQAKIVSKNKSSGFSSGAMGGLAVGMILLGLLLGFAGMIIARKAANRAPDISMERLGNRP